MNYVSFEEYLASYDEAVERALTGEFFVHSPVPIQWETRFETARINIDLLEEIRSKKKQFLQEQSPESTITAPSVTESRIINRIARFEIRGELGRGGFGVVYRAWDPESEREVALKVPHLDSITDWKRQERMFREGELAATLVHPNIVPIYEVLSFDDYCCIVSELCEGGSLAEYCLHHQLSAIQVTHLVLCLSDALDYCHSQGVFHRDVTPANILLSPEPSGPLPFTPRLVDFGLAKPTTIGNLVNPASFFLGTPKYMAPEQIDSTFGSIGSSTDLFGLGNVLLELLDGHPHFVDQSFLEVIDQVRFQSRMPHHVHAGQTVHDLEVIGLKCLNKRPERRFTSAGELSAELNRLLCGESIRTRRHGWWNRCRDWLSQPGRVLEAGVVAISIAFVTVGPLIGCAFFGLMPEWIENAREPWFTSLLFLATFCAAQFVIGWGTLKRSRLAIVAGIWVPPVFAISLACLSFYFAGASEYSAGDEASWRLTMLLEIVAFGLLLFQFLVFCAAVVSLNAVRIGKNRSVASGTQP